MNIRKTMNKPTKKQREEVGKLVEKYRQLLFLNAWHIDVSFMKENDTRGTNAYVEAEIESAVPYQMATISIYPAFWDGTKAEREHIILHEMCHILNASLVQTSKMLLNGHLVTDSQVDMANESSTEAVARVIEDLLPDKR